MEHTGQGTQGLVSQYLGGKIPLNYRAVALFASELGCNPADIRADLPEIGSLGGSVATDVAEWDDILGYAQAVGLGNSVEGDEYAESHKLKFRRESLARKRLRPENLAVIYGKGDSMLPRIRTGDAILFDTTDKKPSDGALFVIIMQGAANAEYNVKRCKVIDDLVLFEADNPAGDHGWRQAKRMDNKRNPIEIVGRVRWIGSWEG